MAYDSKPVWSPVFVREGTVARRRIGRGEHRAEPTVSTGPSVNQTIERFLEAVDEGFARDRYTRPFTRDEARALHWYLGGHVGEALGARSLRDVRRQEVEALIYGLAADGVPRRRLRSLAKSVRTLYDHAAELGLARHNPAERVAIPDEDEAGQPTARGVSAAAAPDLDPLDRAISLTLQLATFGFLLVALILVALSL